MSNEKNESGFFESLLTIAGIISGAVFGYEQAEWIGLILGVLILGGIGKWVGAVADGLLQFAVLVAFLLLHVAVRRFVWEIISDLLSST